MKKFIYVFLALIFVVGLSACKNKNKGDNLSNFVKEWTVAEVASDNVFGEQEENSTVWVAKPLASASQAYTDVPIMDNYVTLKKGNYRLSVEVSVEDNVVANINVASSTLAGNIKVVNQNTKKAIAINELNNEYDNKVYVVDSLCASLGQGLFLDYIVKYADEGKSIKEVINFAEDLKLKIRLEFTVDDLFHLKRGGRVSAATAIVGSLMGIKPILHVNNEGKLIAIDKVRGRRASLKHLANLFKEYNDINENEPVFISHGDSIEDAELLKQFILDIKPNVNVYINYIGPVIGSHAGQGTIALFYKGKER